MASYYEELLGRIENVDLKGKANQPYQKSTLITSSAGRGGTALATPDGRVFGNSNYVPPTSITATPVQQAFNTIATPAPVAAPVVAPAPTGLPGTFGGGAEVGSAGWWGDGRGGNQSVLAPGANVAEAQARLARNAEVDRMNREAERRMSGSRRVGGPATQAGAGYDKKIMAAQASLDADRSQLNKREETVDRAFDVEKEMQRVLSDPVMTAAFQSFLDDFDASKTKGKKKKEEE